METAATIPEVRMLLAKKIREVVAEHGFTLDDPERFTTPKELVKADDSWESRDGTRIPKGGTAPRKRWDKAYMAALKAHFPKIHPEPIKVRVKDIMPSNPPANGNALELYSNMVAAGEELPPVVVEKVHSFGGPQKWSLKDGNHRLHAAKQGKMTHINAVEIRY